MRGRMLVLLAAALARAADGCPLPRRAEELDAALAVVEGAWGEDEAAFLDAVGRARGVLACVAEPVPPAVAARMHRAEGLAAFLGRDAEASARAFAAARALDPEYRFPETMVPPNNPLETTFGLLPAGAATARVPAPAGGRTLWFDGTATRARPEDRPTVFQVQDADGAVRTSAWLPTDAPLPYRARGEGLRLPLLIGAGVAAAGAGALYALAADAHGDYEGSASPDDADANRARVNVLVGASAGAGAVAVGVGAGAFLFGRW